ncbi:hypothetical protein N0V83_005849 [Neocucurbitaria cava]|uniref:Uncharacterized protein n=1 Tax=Neocucurbitaria cava TaxID=798079 RepID=A0A9W8Y6R9_9PLEO|nr:hypothetical protein N0V83_005849 [Neocucurbitaria cava]
MDPSQLARPWTPPETEAQSSPRSDYFSDSFRGGDSAYSSYTEHRWPPGLREELANTAFTPTEDDHRSRPKPIATHTAPPAPYTPTKPFSLAEAPHGAPRYPYTPDSSRMIRRSNTEVPGSPTPWEDSYMSSHSSSPVQNALSSCIAHFENLIQTRQPDEDQMEYIVGQFEAMASYLSAPESQTKTTEEHLFDEGHEGAGLGISREPETKDQEQGGGGEQGVGVSNEYIAEVGRYIAGVQKYIEDLKMRLDEVKTLNSIQLDVITDLRRQMKTVRQGMRSSLSMREEFERAESELELGLELANMGIERSGRDIDGDGDGDIAHEGKEFGIASWETIQILDNHDSDSQPQLLSQQQHHDDRRSEVSLKDLASSLHQSSSSHRHENTLPRGYKRITIIHPPPRGPGFWSSFAEALDEFGALLHEY